MVMRALASPDVGLEGDGVVIVSRPRWTIVISGGIKAAADRACIGAPKTQAGQTVTAF